MVRKRLVQGVKQLAIRVNMRLMTMFCQNCRMEEEGEEPEAEEGADLGQQRGFFVGGGE